MARKAREIRHPEQTTQIAVTKEEDDHHRGLEPNAQDGLKLLETPTVILHGSKPIAYFTPENNFASSAESLFANTQFETFENKQELHFGYSPYNPGRNWEREAFKNNETLPELYGLISIISDQLSNLIREQNSEAAEHAEWAMKDKPRISSSLFNHAILMQNKIVPYHKDYPLVDGSWSALAMWSKDCEGGELVFPTIQIRTKPKGFFLCQSSTLTHGVTSCNIKPGGYRYSLLMYLDKNALR